MDLFALNFGDLSARKGENLSDSFAMKLSFYRLG